MDNSELIQQLFDGELDAQGESSLYSRLAIDSDLRAEMREHLAMKAAIQEDRALLVPPAALTNTVFSGLGFAAPLAGSAAGAAGGSMLINWLSRIGVPFASALAAAGLTFGVIANTDFTVPPSKPVAVSAEENTTVRQSNEELRITPAPPATATRTIVRTVYVPDQTVARQLALLEAENERLQNELAESRQPLSSNIDEPVNVTPVLATQSYTPIRLADSSPFEQRKFAISAPQQYLPGVSLQLRGFALSPTVNTPVPAQTNWWDNFGAALLYRLSPNHTAGIEMGNETYPMVFSGERAGQIIQYDQHPSVMWWGATYRYTGNPWGESHFAPYGQVTLAGSQFGPVGRVATGIQYSPAGPITFLFGAEAASLAYTFQNQWFISPKVGLTYGMAYRF